MGKTRKIVVGLALALFATAGWGQGVFTKYGPVAGIQKSTGLTYQNTAAVSTDVIALFSGCSSSLFLKADGTCANPLGAGITFAAPAPFTVTGSPGTSITLSWTTGQTANQVLATPNGTTGPVGLRALVAADIPSLVAGSTTQIQYNNAGVFAGSADFTWDQTNKVLQFNATNSTTTILRPATNAAGAGRSIQLGGGTSTGGNGIGGGVSIQAGFGNGTGQGGPVTITAGDSGVTGTNNAGDVTISGGRGQTPGPAFGGNVLLNGGTVLADGNGGGITITGAPGVGTNRSGGGLTVNLGAATGTGLAGLTSILGGRGMVVGAPTGGAQGVGTINATGLFVNGVAVGTGGGTPGGSNTQMQYNNSGAFGGAAGLTWDNVNNKLALSVASAGADYINLSSSNTSFVGISEGVSTGHTFAMRASVGGFFLSDGTAATNPISFDNSGNITIGDTAAPFLKCPSGVAGRQCDLVTNGTGGTSVGYMGLVDRAGTRYAYWGKTSNASNLVSYESDNDVQVVSGNGAHTLAMTAAGSLTQDGILLSHGPARIIWGAMSASGAGCTVVNSSFLSGSCTRNSTGNYTIGGVNLQNNMGCTVSVTLTPSNGGRYASISGSSSGIGVTVYNGSNTAVDDNFQFSCMSPI